ncbi:hypothetical protein CLV36_11523 [Laceyella sediminis]|jgi:hypothetical protein|uniref:Uncharacterized protein n=1 Tax=Laceyella sediminis TaxID=573074 RepID=A0ABX5EMF8_9BACL|nr:hypothetical protein [Laceyella sediminis]PRZ12258.1 hypothetical protein CLV36_11523 [Laceyella sediminis]
MKSFIDELANKLKIDADMGISCEIVDFFSNEEIESYQHKVDDHKHIWIDVKMYEYGFTAANALFMSFMAYMSYAHFAVFSSTGGIDWTQYDLLSSMDGKTGFYCHVRIS